MKNDVLLLKEANFFTKSAYLYQYTAGRMLFDKEHFHDFYEMIYVLDGECVHFVNRVKFIMTAGEAMLLTPRDKHAFLSQKTGTNIISLSVSEQEFLSFSKLYQLREETLSPTVFRIPRLELAWLAMLTDAKDRANDIYCRLILGKFLTFLNLHLQRSFPPFSGDDVPTEFSVAIMKLSDPEYAREGVAALCRLSHYSRAQIGRLTKKHLGTTPNQFINDIRLRIAYNAIISTQESVESISENVGFSSVSHFRKIFEEKYHMTPSEARSNHALEHSTVQTV